MKKKRKKIPVGILVIAIMTVYDMSATQLFERWRLACSRESSNMCTQSGSDI